MISQADVAFYREHGYLVVENVIGPALLAELNRVTDEFIDRARRLRSSDSVYDIGEDHTPERPVVRRIKHPDQQHPVFQRALRSPALVDIVAALVGPQVRFDHSKLNLKPPGLESAVEWHQDWAFYPHTNDDLLAVGVMLQDVTDENGPLLVIPGSHRGPTHDHHNGGYFVGAIDPAAAGVDTGKAVALTGPAGSATFHHVRMIHGSTANRTARSRPLLLYSYAAVDAWPIVARKNFDGFNERILRGEPTLAPRQVSLPIRLPMPRRPQVDSIYDDQETVSGRSFGTVDRPQARDAT